jgi:hypothetical protein
MITYYERPGWEEPKNQLEFDYRGFTVRKTLGYQLYSIIPPAGKVMHKELEGEFSHMRILEEKVDLFLAKHETPEAAFVDAEPPKPKRGRPPKSSNLSQQTTEEAIVT